MLKPTNAIKYWNEQDRPREKLLTKGKHILSDAELLAILISTGTRSKSAIDLARDILNLAGNNLNQLAKLTVKDLIKVDGIGEAKAITIISAIELGGRREIAEVKQKTKITGSKDGYNYFRPKLGNLPYEEFWILMLNRANKIIGEAQISDGGVAGTVADPKRIFKTALDNSASSIILCHNHPSGSTNPSDADKQLTRKINEAGKLLDISVLDHLIITDNGYFSFADEGMM